MNQRMTHRYEAVAHTDGTWTVNEVVDGAIVTQTASASKRDAQYDAVRLNRSILRAESTARTEKAASGR